jgi:hypothetical protein
MLLPKLFAAKCSNGVVESDHEVEVEMDLLFWKSPKKAL